MRTSFYLTFCVGFALLTGCDKGKKELSPRYPVSGKVTFQGKPLVKGSIVFDLGNGEPPASFDILDGAYQGNVPAGKNTVRISATRKVSMKDKMGFEGPGYDEVTEEDMLPPRYNLESEITREVTEQGPNVFDFDLKAK